MNAHPNHPSDDDGFTLIELLVTTLLFSMVVVVVGSIFMSLIRTHETVRDSTASANGGQLAATSIETGVRNSSNFRLTNIGSDQLLVARTAGSGATLTWRCAAWYYSASERSIRTTSSTAAIGIPTATALQDWTLLVDEVDPRNGTAVFVKSGTELVVSFDADVERADPVDIEFTVIPPVNDPLETSCF